MIQHKDRSTLGISLQLSAKQKPFAYTGMLALMVGTVVTIALQLKLPGYAILALGAALSLGAGRAFYRHILLVFLAIGIIGFTPISTDLSLSHFMTMGALISLAVAIPYVITRYVYREDVIRFPFGKYKWTRSHVGYLLLAAVLSYLILPFWMQSTGGHLNWTVIPNAYHLTVLFIGTNGLGVWDELFFIVTVLGLLRRHFPFWQANLFQAVLFTSFLFELGFRGWAPLIVFPFALLQGEVFRRTENLLYVIAIHLTIDFVLYLALINAHLPHLVDVFIGQ